MERSGTRHEDRIAAVVDRLAHQTGGRLPVELIEDRVRAEFAQWDEAHVDAYVPIFVERRVADGLGLRRQAIDHPARGSLARAEQRDTGTGAVIDAPLATS
jgi:glutathione S-transferase